MPAVTGLLNTDVMNGVDCPQCHQSAGTCCVTHRGKKMATPHAPRISEYEARHPDRKALYRSSPDQRERVRDYNRKHAAKKK